MSFHQTDLRKLHIIQVDDHKLFLAGMRTAIHSRYPNAIIEDFTTNDKASNRLKEILHYKKQPDIVITDYNHPGGNGLEFAHEVKSLAEKHGVKIPILMVTMVEMKSILSEGLENSPLDGYLTKAASTDEILELIQKFIPRVFSEN